VFHEVEKIYAVTGAVDIILFVRMANVKELDAFLIRKLRNIKGITNTTTQIVLEEG
jgi:DNA-binding Lrp family transcriptional regulator